MPDSVGTWPPIANKSGPDVSGLDVVISITKFPTQAASSKQDYSGSLRSILGALRDTCALAKATLPWLKLATFGDLRTDKGSLRHDRNLQSISGVEGDYDGERITIERAQQILQQANIAAVLYTSPSHTPQAPRWRVLCPTSTPLPPGERSRLLSRINGLFVGALSNESWTLSQSYYYGAVQGAEHHTVLAIDGRPIDAATELDECAIGKPAPPKIEHTDTASAPPLRDGEASPYARKALESECQAIVYAADGSKHYALNKAAYSIGGLVAAGEIDEGFAFHSLLAALISIRERCEDFAHAEKTLAAAFADGVKAPRQKPESTYQPKAIGMFGLPGEGEVVITTPSESAGNQQRPDKSPLPLVYFHEAQPNLDTADFVEGVLTEGGMSVVYGESNCGKTFFATDLSLHVAMGKPWRGREIERGGVIYCALEGSHGILNRVAAFRRHHALDGVEIPFAVIPVTLNLLDPNADTPRLIETIRHATAQMEAPVKMVVLDTLSRAMAGGNENAPDDMGALVTNDAIIRQAVNAHLMWIHHSGKDAAKGARGHSLLRAATDTEIEIAREDKDAPSIATVKKQRELENSGEWGFRLQTVELGLNRRGKSVTSCVVVDSDSKTDGARPKINLSGDQQMALRVLHDTLAEVGEPDFPGTPNGIRSIPEEWWRDRYYSRVKPGADANTKRKSFRRAADVLIEFRLAAANRGRVWAI